jgi:hypothetical protein
MRNPSKLTPSCLGGYKKLVLFIFDLTCDLKFPRGKRDFSNDTLTVVPDNFATG